MTRVTCRLTAKSRDQLWNPTLGSRVWATFFLISRRTSYTNVPAVEASRVWLKIDFAGSTWGFQRARTSSGVKLNKSSQNWNIVTRSWPRPRSSRRPRRHVAAAAAATTLSVEVTPSSCVDAAENQSQQLLATRRSEGRIFQPPPVRSSINLSVGRKADTENAEGSIFFEAVYDDPKLMLSLFLMFFVGLSYVRDFGNS